jgi:tRNA wybutosine-synthesizing protein 1
MGRQTGAVSESKYYSKLRESKKCIPPGMLQALVRQKYHIVGEHSAAKICHWAGLSMQENGECYKSRFYGISSHRCLQCTPVLLFCNHACVFCWRMMPEKKVGASDLPPGKFEWEDPKKIAGGLISAQRDIVSGFGGNPKVSREKYLEACAPKHVALSLTGEPTMYPKMEGLLQEFHARGMTTFLVTNGTFPERVARWKTFPTQFYVSMVAPNEEVYKKAIRPSSIALWKKYLKMLELMSRIGKKTRTVLRMTIVRSMNDSDLEGYAKQIKIASPHYIEVKSMVFVGGAREKSRGLTLDSMLNMDEVVEIAQKLAKMAGYVVSDMHAPSRVVLLCRDQKTEADRKIIWQ